jgi:NADPH2:quinone reductase
MMQIVAYHKTGLATDLYHTTHPIPEIPASNSGKVLLKVHAAGINRPDILQRQGHYPVPAGASPILGLEVAGEVIGGDMNHPILSSPLHTGQAVCALLTGGGYAEYVIADTGLCLPLPQHWTWVQAAALPETLFTVWHNLCDLANLQSPDKTSVLIHGGSSGIGTVAIQLAKCLEKQVIITAGNDEKCQACLTLGADLAINYHQDDFVTAVMNASHLHQGDGVDVILDMVGGDYTSRNLRCLAPHGTLVNIAFLNGKQSQIDWSLIMRKQLTLTGSMLRPQSVTAKITIARQLYQHVWPWLNNTKSSTILRPVINYTINYWDIEEIQAAHQRIEHHQHIGKIVLDYSK